MEILTKSSRGLQIVPLHAVAFEDRIIMLNGEINEKTTTDFYLELHELQKRNDKDITLLINSGGGEVDSGIAICDMMESSKCKIHTICTGKAYSMASLILACGDKRSITKRSKVMIHQPFFNGNISGKLEDLKIADELLKEKKEMIISLLTEKTNVSKDKIEEMIKKDCYLSAKEAIDFGIVDFIEGGQYET